MRLFIARLRQGKTGEWQRVVHQFKVDEATPDKVTAVCGKSFAQVDLEMLSHISGMPCVGCLAAPKPVAELESGVGLAESIRHAVDFLEWWLPLNEHTAGSEAVESIKVLMDAARLILDPH